MDFIKFKKKLLSGAGVEILLGSLDYLKELEAVVSVINADGQKIIVTFVNDLSIDVVAEAFLALNVSLAFSDDVISTITANLLEELGLNILYQFNILTDIEAQDYIGLKTIVNNYQIQNNFYVSGVVGDSGEISLNFSGDLISQLSMALGDIDFISLFTTLSLLSTTTTTLNSSQIISLTFSDNIVSTISATFAEEINFILNFIGNINSTILGNTRNATRATISGNLEIISDIMMLTLRFAILNDYDANTLATYDTNTLHKLDYIE